MMSSSKKPANDVESGSDWDSLPGDVPEPDSSPEPNSPLPRAPVHSLTLSPAPPKQPYTKHHPSTKPINMYKNASNLIRKSGSTTTFEDRSGGLYDENDIEVKFSKENDNNVKKNNESIKEKQESVMTKGLNVQGQEKRPPYTDFREALSSPTSDIPTTREQHKMVGVNQAYRIETEDEIKTNHDSWDDSEHSSPINEHRSATDATKQKLSMNRDHDGQYKSHQVNMNNNEVMKMPSGSHHFSTNQNFENCCLIQVAEGAFDDRYRPSFFHGSQNHFHVRKDDPRASITNIAEKSEVILQRFWREVFGALQILINFFIIFILELFKTVVLSVRYFLIGILYTTGDHFIKPLLSALFNNFIQPFSVLLLNVFAIITNLLKPILGLTREVLSQVAIPLQAFRLFVLNWEYRRKDDHMCTDVKVI